MNSSSQEDYGPIFLISFLRTNNNLSQWPLFDTMGQNRFIKVDFIFTIFCAFKLNFIDRILQILICIWVNISKKDMVI